MQIFSKASRQAADTRPDAAAHAMLLGLISGLFLMPLLAAAGWLPTWLPGGVTLATLVAGSLALRRDGFFGWAVAAAMILAGVTQGVPGPTPDWTMAGALFLLALALLRSVLGPGQVTIARIQGALTLYLVVALLFAHLYEGLAAALPGSFAGPMEDPGSLRYLSLVVQTSTGLGDIVPAGAVARTLVTLQAVTGQMFIAILLARLVSLEIASRRSGPP
ncbi:two pore domain potassium channel family protein [Roseomonas sp. AR75]|uniref:two pore domain potassium channel family protein n=1 Tax=Roseomonas sp. AR75 TaxID=2562311 RepID=UPI0014859660|nr:two pore domain potassium channel family protein [Roseomonas sp. AR75]